MINELNWKKDFFNLDINEMVSVISTTIKNIMANFISQETVICGDKGPPWIKLIIKKIIHE